MCKSNNRYWLETDDFLTTLEKTLEKLTKTYCQLFLLTLFLRWGLLLHLH